MPEFEKLMGNIITWFFWKRYEYRIVIFLLNMYNVIIIIRRALVLFQKNSAALKIGANFRG